MSFKLTATITHKSFDVPVTKEIYFIEHSLEDVLAKIKADHVPPNHVHNLQYYRKTGFKDARGVKHQWKLEEI